jgi:diphthamide biosynthesis enzyme Dph1/Dph2-like protein
METLFIKAIKKNKDFSLDKLDYLKQKNKKIMLFYTAQYSLLSEEVVNFFGKNIIDKKPRQILGCSNIILDKKQKKDYLVIVVADGRFHALPLATNNNLPVYIFNGYELNKISEKEITKAQQLRKTKKIKFLSSEEIGLICSVKKHQCNFNEMIKTYENLKKQNKNSYLFVFETLNFQELENFCLDVYVNFSCPGIETDNKKILNFNSIKEFC